MEVKPIAKYKSPAYPNREEILKNPELLQKLPARWRGNAYVAAALSSLLIMTLTACDKKVEVKSPAVTPAGQPPVFVHGDGRGSFGCVSIAPPAFLSEEEAFSVIAEEAQREGIILKKDGPVLENIMIPKTDTFYEENEEKIKSRKGSITLDGTDESKGIAFEFVSQDDIHAWQDKDSGRYSSVESFRFLDTAQVLAEGMKDSAGSTKVATFYDPHYKFDSPDIQKIINDHKDDNEKMEQALKEQVKSDLREQVRDFLSWLKGQDII